MVATPASLRARFTEAGIKCAAVIDDSFDEAANVRLAVEVDEFWAEIQDNPQWQVELNQRNIPCQDKASLSTEGLRKLWDSRKEFTGKLGAFVTRVFVRADENLAAPQTVAKYLSDEFGISQVVPLSGDENAERKLSKEARLVFLDYNLEGDDRTTLTPETRRSVKIAIALLSRRSNAPFLVLFSSVDDATKLAEEFRIHTGYLRGTFLFISKKDAVNLATLCDRLSSSCVESRDLGRFQHFFLAISERLKEVTQKVKSDVMQLDVQDYAFMQRMALQEDGAPLGEYMLDLFGAVLSHDLRNGKEVLNARRELDKLYFGENHLPFSTQPSIPIREIYRAFLTEPGVGDAAPHPQVAGGKIEVVNGKNYKAPPLLMLGDIFGRDADHPVYAVMNPACDLQYSPRNPKRQPQLDRSVFLLTGRLEPLDSSLSPGTQKRLEMLEFGNGLYWRVRWYRDEIVTVPLGRFAKWQKAGHYTRIARLNGIQSLSLQWFWTSSLTRVGLPVSPPFYDACDISVYLPTSTAWRKVRGDCPLQAIVVRHPRQGNEPVHFTLTEKGAKFLYQQLNKAVGKLDSLPKRKSSGQALISDLSFWSNITRIPQELQLKKESFRCLVRPVNSDKDSLLCLWKSKPKPADLTSGQNVTLAVVLNPTAGLPSTTTNG